MPSLFRRGSGALRWLLLFGLVATLLLVGTCCRPGGEGLSSGSPTSFDELDDLQADIRLLDMINSLDLTTKQIDRLIPVVIRLQNLQTDYEQRKQAVTRQILPLLEQRRDALIKGTTPPRRLEQDLSRFEAKLSAVNDELWLAQEKYTTEVCKILQPAQVGVITGTEEARRRAEDLLAWFREMPAADYADESVATSEALDSPEIELDAKMLQQTFDIARSLTSAQYEVKKAELVDRIAPLYGATAEAEQRALLGVFGHWRVVEVLRDKNQAMSG